MIQIDHGHGRRPEIVARSVHGRVTRCDDCSALHLQFGNAVLSLDPTDLPTFHGAVRTSATAGPRGTAGRRSVELYVGESGVGFAFTRDEIAELDALLSSAEQWLANGRATALPTSIERRITGRPNANS